MVYLCQENTSAPRGSCYSPFNCGNPVCDDDHPALLLVLYRSQPTRRSSHPSISFDSNGGNNHIRGRLPCHKTCLANAQTLTVAFSDLSTAPTPKPAITRMTHLTLQFLGNAVTSEVGPGTQVSDFATYRDLRAAQHGQTSMEVRAALSIRPARLWAHSSKSLRGRGGRTRP